MRPVWRGAITAPELTAQENLDFATNFVHQAGRRVTHPDQLSDKEYLVMPNTLVNLSRVDSALKDAKDAHSIKLLEEIKEGRQAIVDISDSAMRPGLQKAMEMSMGESAERIAQALKLFDETGDMPEMWAVPKQMGDRFTAQFGHNLPNAKLWIGAPMNIWRNWVLSGSPRWVVNNVVGNAVMLKMGGGRMSDVFRLLSPEYKRRVEAMIGPMASPKVASGMFANLSMRATHAGSAYEHAVGGDIVRTMAESPAWQKGAVGWLRDRGEWMKRLNEGAEDLFRDAMYIKASERVAIKGEIAGLGHKFWTSKETLDHMFEVGLNEKSASEAVNVVNAFLNDYTASTPTVRNIVRPYIAPFWSFYRHSTTLLFTAPFKIPGTTRAMALLGEAAQDVQIPLGLGPGMVPPWLASAMPIGSSTTGDQRYFSAAGPNPFNMLTGSYVNILNPIAKMLLEKGTGRSMLTGQKFDSPDVVTPFGSDQQYRVMMGPEGKPMAVPIATNAPPWWEQILSQYPQYQMSKDLLANATTYDTTSIIDLIQGKGVKIDPATGEPIYPKDRLATIGKFFGFSTTPFNIQDYQASKAAEQAAALKEWLKQHPEGTAMG